MKIVFLMMTTELAGTERATLETILALRERGHECLVYSLQPFGALKPILDDSGIPSEEIGSRGYKGWKTYFALRRYLARVQPDTVILNGHDIDAALAVALAKGIRRKILAVHHCHRGTKPSWFWRLCYKLARRGFNAVVFCSGFLRDEAIAIYPAVSEIAHVIANPVPDKALVDAAAKSAARERLGLPPGHFIVGVAGRIEPEKRLDVFLDVAQRITESAANVHFAIAGSGSLAGDLKQRCAHMGLGDKVHWLGWLPDMTDFYVSLDALLFHSDGDSFGLSAADAMSYGVPVVASVTYGGLSELIDSDEVSVCLDRHDVPVLAEAVLSLRGARGPKVGERARERVHAFCSPVNSAMQFEALLRE